MGGGSGQDTETVDRRVPVPDAEAEALASKIDQMIEQLDGLITDRSSGLANKLAAWDAPNRVGWEEDFHFSQTDLFVAIDRLQWFKTRVEGVVEAIREHNASVPDAGGGSW
jgi:hypothetical protein